MSNKLQGTIKSGLSLSSISEKERAKGKKHLPFYNEQSDWQALSSNYDILTTSGWAVVDGGWFCVVIALEPSGTL